MSKALYIVAVTLSLLLLSCSNPQPEAPGLLRQAEQLVDSNPDSAMHLIDSIHYPEKSLEHGQYMHYLVTRVQVRYKNYRDIAGDTLVFDAAHYFARKGKDPNQAALAHFYSGCVRREQGRLDPAMKYYKDADRYAEKAKDANLQGLIQYNIGDLLNEHGLYEKAIANYKNAVQLYRELPRKQAHALSAVGRMFLVEGDADSALLYFHKGMELANHTDDNALQSLLAQNLSIAYNKKAQYGDAEKYLRQSFSLNQNSSKLSRYYLNFAELYLRTGQSDSAALYADKLKPLIDTLNNTPFHASAYGFLAEWEKKQGYYDKALNYREQYARTIENVADAHLQQSVYEIQRKYDFAQEKILHQQQLNQRQYWIILLLFAVIIGGTVFTLYAFRQKNKLSNTLIYIETLQGMAKEMEKSHEKEILTKDKNLRDLLLWKFNVVKKASLISEKGDNDKNPAALIKRFQKIVYDENTDDRWLGILSIFNEVNPDIYKKLLEKYPNLDPHEYKIALLTYAGMKVTEIAVILQFKPNTVQSYGNSLRKKLNIGEDTRTALFLKTELNN